MQRKPRFAHYCSNPDLLLLHPCFGAWPTFPIDVTCVMIPASTPTLRKFITSSPRNDQGTLGRKVDTEEIQAQTRDETHYRWPCYGECGSSPPDTSPKFVSGQYVSAYVVNPNGHEDACRQLSRRNRRGRQNDPSRGEFGERAGLGSFQLHQKSYNSLKYVLCLSGIPFTTSRGLGIIQTRLAVFHGLPSSGLSLCFDTLPAPLRGLPEYLDCALTWKRT
jgi:hypothetical protein